MNLQSHRCLVVVFAASIFVACGSGSAGNSFDPSAQAEALTGTLPRGTTGLEFGNIEVVDQPASASAPVVVLATFTGPHVEQSATYEIFETRDRAVAALEDALQTDSLRVQEGNTFAAETCIQRKRRVQCFRGVDNALLTGESLSRDDATEGSQLAALLLVRTAFKHWRAVFPV